METLWATRRCPHPRTLRDRIESAKVHLFIQPVGHGAQAGAHEREHQREDSDVARGVRTGIRAGGVIFGGSAWSRDALGGVSRGTTACARPYLRTQNVS